MRDPNCLALTSEIARQQVGGNDGLPSPGGELHHHPSVFGGEGLLDLFEQVTLVVA
jgi:hypothetical protein